MNSPELQPSVYIQQKLTSIHIEEWLDEDVLRLRWWILLFMFIASLVAWFLLLDKKRMKSVVLFAAFETVFVLALNEYGDELLLWDYPTDVIPVFPPLTSINLFILPLAYSLVYQRFKTTKGFYLWASILSAVIGFGLQPLLALSTFYELVNWRHAFNFPFYFACAAISRELTNKIDRITARCAGENRTEV